MKSLISIFIMFFCLNINANVITITPQNPVILFSNRTLDDLSIHAPSTMIQIYASNHLSNEDLVIGNITVLTPYNIPGLNKTFHPTEDILTFVFDLNPPNYEYNNEFIIPAGTNAILGSTNDTWFVISDMLGLGGKSYFGNSYYAEIENYIKVVVAGYYVDQLGIPTKSFKEEIILDTLTF